MFFLKEAYKCWGIKTSNYPYNGTSEEKIKFLLGYAILAPSTFNSQPWKCRIDKNQVKVFLDSERMPRKSDKTGRFGFISIGCFIENFIIAAKHFNFQVGIQLSPRPLKGLALVAVIRLSERKKQKVQDKLFSSITRRITNRSLSINKEIEGKIIDELKHLPEKDQKIIVLDRSSQNKLIAISIKADIEIWSDIDFRREHVSWIRNNLTRLKDGMPAFGVGIGLVPSFFARPVVLSPLWPRIQAKKNKKALSSTPNFIVLCSKDGLEAWVRIGMLYERISLLLMASGITTAPMGQFIESDSARRKLKKLVGNGFIPQLFFRIGYPSKSTPHSPRLSVDDLLI